MEKINGIIETALYTENLERSTAFYRQVLGFETLAGDERFHAFSVAGNHVLLIFLKGVSRTPTPLPGGIVPPHDGEGPVHLGFSVNTGSLEAWENRLKTHQVTIESRMTWERGGASIYFRDPDGHLLELLSPGVWAIY